jgi:hypothetical protein
MRNAFHQHKIAEGQYSVEHNTWLLRIGVFCILTVRVFLIMIYLFRLHYGHLFYSCAFVVLGVKELRVCVDINL